MLAPAVERPRLSEMRTKTRSMAGAILVSAPACQPLARKFPLRKTGSLRLSADTASGQQLPLFLAILQARHLLPEGLAGPEEGRLSGGNLQRIAGTGIAPLSGITAPRPKTPEAWLPARAAGWKLSAADEGKRCDARPSSGPTRAWG